MHELPNQNPVGESHEQVSSLRYAIVRGIPESYVNAAITQYYVGDRPNLEITRQQHQQYIDLLRHIGFTVVWLPADEKYPDCPFVEDPFVVIGATALKTIPGAASRRGEGDKMEILLSRHGKTIIEMQDPGTLDGGDVLKITDETGQVVQIYVGLSARTNQAGIDQLRDAFVQYEGLTPENIIAVPINEGCLHLKTATTYIGDGILLLDPSGVDPKYFEGNDFDIILLDENEKYAANCIRASGNTLIMPEGFPNTRAKIEAAFERKGKQVSIFELPMSEFEKADGGLTCLSSLF